MMDKREILHDRGIKYFEENNFKTVFAFPTGTGKSVLTIKLLDKYQGKYLLLTPTVLLHKENWKKEFEKFDKLDLYEKLDRACYNSIYKYDLSEYDGIILDEAHHISEKRFEYIEQFLPYKGKIIALTATPGKWGKKRTFLSKLSNGKIYDFTITKAVNQNMVNDFEIYVFYTKLDNVNKNIKAGSKTKSFYTTEESNYNYLTNRINSMKEEMKESAIFRIKNKAIYEVLIRKRARMMYDLTSKMEYIKSFLKEVPSNNRMLIFARTIETAEILEKNSVHSKTNSDKILNDFINNKIQRISSVDMLTEGVTLNEIDIIVMTSPSSERKFIQTLGRGLRNKDNKKCKYVIFCTENTVEENWLEQSVLSTIESHKIKEYHL